MKLHRARSQLARSWRHASKSKLSGIYGSGRMQKFAWPSLFAHSSLGSAIRIGGISEDGMRCPGRFAFGWNEEIDGFVLRGGEGIPASWGVVTESMGVTCPLKGSCGSRSATEGDCNGDCMGISRWPKISVIRGGSNGVVAKSASRAAMSLFAFSISIGSAGQGSSRQSNTLAVGVGGIWGSNGWSSACRVEFETEDDRLDAAREAAFSFWESETMEPVELVPFLDRHLRENDGNRFPSRPASPVRGDSFTLRFFERELSEYSPSLRNPSARS